MKKILHNLSQKAYTIFIDCGNLIALNAKLAKEVDEQERIMDEKTRLLDEAIEEMKDKCKEMEEAALRKEDEDTNTSKGKLKGNFQDEIHEPNPPLGKK